MEFLFFHEYYKETSVYLMKTSSLFHLDVMCILAVVLANTCICPVGKSNIVCTGDKDISLHRTFSRIVLKFQPPPSDLNHMCSSPFVCWGKRRRWKDIVCILGILR